MVFYAVGWNELEPEEGRYAFEDWERRFWSRENARGKHVIFRVHIDRPHFPSGLPRWLRDQGVRTTPYSDYGGGESPDYENPRLVRALERFIAALGKRYDEHPRVAFVQLGLLGFWGEWHTYPRLELFASEATQRRVIDAYHRAFPHKSLMARNAGGYMGRQPWLGFHDDLFPEDTDGPEGWKFLSRMRENGRTGNWMRAVIGGEMVPDQARKWLGPDYARTLAMIEAAHCTWLGPYCPALEQHGDREFAARAAALVRRMGYQYTFQEIRHPERVRSGQPLEFRLVGENQGVAPFYYPWRVELALLDGKGRAAGILPLDWDIRRWLPGRFAERTAPVVQARPGRYRLALGIRDPWTGKPAIHFANQLPRSEGWTIVSRIEVAD